MTSATLREWIKTTSCPHSTTKVGIWSIVLLAGSVLVRMTDLWAVSASPILKHMRREY
jgi:hypothetical protein